MRSASILAFLLLPAAADEVILSDGSRLKGTVTALADGGRVAMESELSYEPFQVRADHLRRVEFDATGSVEDRHDGMVTLANGDQFPADLVAIDETTVTVRTGFAGELRIPRDAAATVQLGVRPRRTIYEGPSGEDGWTVKNGWRYDSNRFSAEGTGTLSRTFDVPGSFALKYRLTWRSSPNLQTYFACDSFETTGRTDRYFLQFGSAGFELKRQDAGGNGSYYSMAVIPRLPSEFDGSSVEVELLFDRKFRKVHVFLDGKKEGEYPDPAKSVPMGQGVMFRSLLNGDDSQQISRIEVREWDATSHRHGHEERGDTARDVVITRSSDRGTGTILSMAEGDGGGTVRYKGPHHPEPVDLELADISTMFFARPASDGAAAATTPLKLGLRGRGSLRVTRCTFTDESITAQHPLLGELAIRRAAVASLQRSAPKPQEEHPEPEDE